jgi:hypothetical protein
VTGLTRDPAKNATLLDRLRRIQTECESLATYYRILHDKTIAFVGAFIAEAKGQLAKLGAAKLTLKQANAEAMRLAESDPSFVHKSQREWAAAIGCADGQVTKMPFWREVAARTGRDLKGKGRKPRVVSLTDKALAATADPQAELNCLIREQQADAEPSPLDEDRPDRGTKVRTRKKL